MAAPEYEVRGGAHRDSGTIIAPLGAVLPPPEEERDVKTAIGAARAKQARGEIRKAS